MNASDGIIFGLLGGAMGSALFLLWRYARERQSMMTRHALGSPRGGARSTEEEEATRGAPPLPAPSAPLVTDARDSTDDASAGTLTPESPMKESRTAPDRDPHAIHRSREAPHAPEMRLLARRAGGHRGSLWISPALPPEFERARLRRELHVLLERRREARRRILLASSGALILIAGSLLIPPVRSALKPYATWAGIRLGLLPPPPPPEPAPPPKDLEVSYSNHVEERGGRLLFRGTVRNTSNSRTFENLYAELSLLKRESRLIETRIVPVRPSRLGPGETGIYELTVPASEFMGNRRVRILSEGREVPYRYAVPEAPAPK
jgi:hypothetical protein